MVVRLICFSPQLPSQFSQLLLNVDCLVFAPVDCRKRIPEVSVHFFIEFPPSQRNFTIRILIIFESMDPWLIHHHCFIVSSEVFGCWHYLSLSDVSEATWGEIVIILAWPLREVVIFRVVDRHGVTWRKWHPFSKGSFAIVGVSCLLVEIFRRTHFNTLQTVVKLAFSSFIFFLLFHFLSLLSRSHFLNLAIKLLSVPISFIFFLLVLIREGGWSDNFGLTSGEVSRRRRDIDILPDVPDRHFFF